MVPWTLLVVEVAIALLTVGGILALALANAPTRPDDELPHPDPDSREDGPGVPA